MGRTRERFTRISAYKCMQKMSSVASATCFWGRSNWRVELARAWLQLLIEPVLQTQEFIRSGWFRGKVSSLLARNMPSAPHSTRTTKHQRGRESHKSEAASSERGSVGGRSSLKHGKGSGRLWWENSWAERVLTRINKQGSSSINTNLQMVRCGHSKTWSVS